MSERLRAVHEHRAVVCRARVITFPHGRIGACWRALMVPGFLVGLVAGCAPPPPHIVRTPQTVSPPDGPDEGVITLVRPIAPAGGDASEDASAAILAALGVSATAAGSRAEIIVHADDGETRSVVQSDSAGLVPGQRVLLLHDGTIRPLPLSAVVPARARRAYADARTPRISPSFSG